MFTIIGADGKEYGPVSADKLREWIASGRANAQTQCRREGESAWSTLGSLPEFSGAFATPPPPVAPPGGTSSEARQVDPEAYAAAILARGTTFDLGAALSRSWELLKSDYWTVVGVTAAMIIVIAVINFIPLAGLVLNGLLLGGLQYYYLKRYRGQKAELGDGFIGFSMLTGTLIVANLVVTLLIVLGLFLLILPGIYLAVAYTFTFLLVLDHKLDFWPAMEVSRRVVTKYWFWIFLLIIVAGVLSALGIVLLGIGYFLTAPIFYGAVVAAYEQLIGPRRD
jgi:hypothetical protein